MAYPPRTPELTYADYLALETSTRDKHEFHQGEIFAMAGGGSGRVAFDELPVDIGELRERAAG